MSESKLYIGEVAGYKFNTFIGKFKLETWATSEKEAKRNFAYQIKKQCNLIPSSNIRIEGTIKVKEL